MTPAVSVVIPVYNAADVLEASVGRLVRVLESVGEDYEILLRDDGSQDKSEEVLENISRRYEKVKSSSNGLNQGLGFTLRALFKEARGDIIIYCDIDLPFGEGIVSRLLEEIKGRDIAVASRYSGGHGRVKFLRRVISRLYYAFCKRLLFIEVSDIGSGSVAITRGAMTLLNLKSSGFAVHAEMYAQASRKGLRIREFPAVSRPDGLSSFSVARHGVGVIRETMWLLWNQRSLRAAEK
jgi:glycosyltransferase involved in cell wall biosynthesis